MTKFHRFIAKILFRSKGVNELDVMKKIIESYTTKERKGLKLFDYINKINGLLDDLKSVEVFIRRYPLKDYYEKNNIDQLKFIKYHYEVFLHKIHTILEVKKLVLNELYSIGLSEKECSWNELKKHNEIQKSPLTKVINKYYKDFNDVIEHRHLNTHRAVFQDEKNSDLSLRNFFYLREKQTGEKLNDEFKSNLPKYLIDFEISEYRKEIINEVKEINIRISEYNQEFENILFEEFMNCH
ncbi:hypothetical protein J2X97_000689 [Epilithonimonas hungarica]|uniref:Cthe_2314 family HEPN domain-containing protein n=1 Tax=Epilithonimonas hungarica TaxID=454006 RepID=UPI00278369B1|nr:Cthe_2314 family HEPN domain-containing protein [Epilithonimonas hungarica]MDP9955052.1 hypothetical protein [Epilithonimonas hungarica]